MGRTALGCRALISRRCLSISWYLSARASICSSQRRSPKAWNFAQTTPNSSFDRQGSEAGARWGISFSGLCPATVTARVAGRSLQNTPLTLIPPERAGVSAITPAMQTPMTDEDRELDGLWRERFGEPLPILGAGEFVRAVLCANDDTTSLADAA